MAASNVQDDSTMVAIYPPKGWRDLLGPHTTLAQWDNLHVTLVYLGKKSPEEARKALEIIEPIVARHKPIRMKCNGAAAFDNPDAVVRVLQPNGIGLNELRAAIYKSLDEADLLDDQKHGFVPHMTLEYHEDRKLPKNWERVAKLPFGRWTVNDVRVVRGNKEIGRARLGENIKESQMTPFEQGYHRFMKFAFDNPFAEEDEGLSRGAHAGLAGAGGLTAGLVGRDVHRVGKMRHMLGRSGGMVFGLADPDIANKGFLKRMGQGAKNISNLGGVGKGALGLGLAGAGTALYSGARALGLGDD